MGTYPAEVIEIVTTRGFTSERSAEIIVVAEAIFRQHGFAALSDMATSARGASNPLCSLRTACPVDLVRQLEPLLLGADEQIIALASAMEDVGKFFQDIGIQNA